MNLSTLFRIFHLFVVNDICLFLQHLRNKSVFEIVFFEGDQTTLVILRISIALVVNLSAEAMEQSLSKLCFINVPTFVDHPSDSMDSLFVAAVQSI